MNVRRTMICEIISTTGRAWGMCDVTTLLLMLLLSARDAGWCRLKLYYGISHDGGGRQDYLRTRMILQPEDRYHLPLLTSWQYGWQIAHKEELFDRPSYRRTSRIQESFFSRNTVPRLQTDHPEVPTIVTETH